MISTISNPPRTAPDGESLYPKLFERKFQFEKGVFLAVYGTFAVAVTVGSMIEIESHFGPEKANHRVGYSPWWPWRLDIALAEVTNALDTLTRMPHVATLIGEARHGASSRPQLLTSRGRGEPCTTNNCRAAQRRGWDAATARTVSLRHGSKLPSRWVFFFPTSTAVSSSFGLVYGSTG